jgi:purine-binding chemotaxis protein CheW
VLRLDRLFGLDESPLQIYQHIVLLNGDDPPLALLTDQVVGVERIAAGRIAPVAESDTLNGCVAGQVRRGDRVVNVLALDRLLAAHERRRLAEFQSMQDRRLRDFQATAP